MKDCTGIKLIISIVVGFLIDSLGGWDNLLAFVSLLVVIDTISGVLKAIKNKTLSSTKMREGLFKKAMIVLIVAIAVQGDKVLIDYFGHPIMWGDKEFYLRTAFLLWFALEELISLIENADALGVPLPKWLQQILVCVNNKITGSTPTQILSLIETVFHIKIGSIEDKNVEDEDSSNDNTSLDK